MNRPKDAMKAVELSLDNVALALDECRVDELAVEIIDGAETLARDIYADGDVTRAEHSALMTRLSLVRAAVERNLAMDRRDLMIARELAGVLDRPMKRAACEAAPGAA